MYIITQTTFSLSTLLYHFIIFYRNKRRGIKPSEIKKVYVLNLEPVEKAITPLYSSVFILLLNGLLKTNRKSYGLWPLCYT